MAQQTTYRLDKSKLYFTIAMALVLMIIFAAFKWRTLSKPKNYIVKIEPLDDGNDLIKENDIKTIVRRSFEEDIKEVQIGRIDVARIESKLEEDPFVKKAQVYIDATNNLNIDIKQRQPILRVIDENGFNYYMDTSGYKIPPSKYFTARVIVATGAIPPYTDDFRKKQKSVLTDLFRLTKRILSDPFLQAEVQQIYVNPEGDFTLIPVLGDQKIILGNLANLEDKLQRLRIFYDKALPYEGWKKYETINLKFKGQIVCKKY
jgi:cell division protein FtsQ